MYIYVICPTFAYLFLLDLPLYTVLKNISITRRQIPLRLAGNGQSHGENPRLSAGWRKTFWHLLESVFPLISLAHLCPADSLLSILYIYITAIPSYVLCISLFRIKKKKYDYEWYSHYDLGRHIITSRYIKLSVHKELNLDRMSSKNKLKIEKKRLFDELVGYK